MADKDYSTVLLEQLVDQNKAVLELVGGLPTRADFNRLEQRVDDLHADVKVIRAAVTDHSAKLADLDTRVSALEAA
jgi:hypothetical protein